MELRIRPFFVALSVSLASVAVLIVLVIAHNSRNSSLSELVRRLPGADATAVYLDLAAIRSSGLLDQLASVEVEMEPDYRDFIEATGFNYEQDLDFVLASFQEFETFLLLKGRFDWRRLRDYVDSQRGNCNNGFCQLSGSEADRQISFFAVTPKVMAMSIGADPWSATLLFQDDGDSPVGEVPQAPVWITAPGSALARADWMPQGAQTFASQLVDASRVTLTLSANGSEFESRLRVDCRSAPAAEGLASQLQRMTDAIGALMDHQSAEADALSLADVLAEGLFRSEGAIVHGTWPVSQSLLRAILSGPQ